MIFLFDANISWRIAEGLNILEQGNNRNVNQIIIEHADKILGAGAEDIDVIREAGKKSAVIISQDDDFKRIKVNRGLIIQLMVGYVLYRPPRHGSRYWEIVESFVAGWQGLREKLSTETFPFIYEIDKFGKSKKVNIS